MCLFLAPLSVGRKHVVFGKVVMGMDVVKKMEQLGTADGKPLGVVKIVDCGEMSKTKVQNSVEAEKGIATLRWKRFFSASLTILYLTFLHMT